MKTEDKKQLQKKFGNTLKKIREQSHIEPKNIAAALKISVQQYGNIESGKSEVGICKIFEIAFFLKIPVTELLNLETSLVYNNYVHTQDNGSVIQGNNTVNNFVEKEYLAFLKQENIYLKKKLDDAFEKIK